MNDYKAASEKTDEAERGLTSAVPHTPRTHITFIRRDGIHTHVEILTGGHPLSSDKLANLVRFLARHEERKFTIHHDELIERSARADRKAFSEALQKAKETIGFFACGAPSERAKIAADLWNVIDKAQQDYNETDK